MQGVFLPTRDVVVPSLWMAIKVAIGPGIRWGVPMGLPLARAERGPREQPVSRIICSGIPRVRTPGRSRTRESTDVEARTVSSFGGVGQWGVDRTFAIPREALRVAPGLSRVCQRDGSRTHPGIFRDIRPTAADQAC